MISSTAPTLEERVNKIEEQLLDFNSILSMEPKDALKSLLGKRLILYRTGERVVPNGANYAAFHYDNHVVKIIPDLEKNEIYVTHTHHASNSYSPNHFLEVSQPDLMSFVYKLVGKIQQKIFFGAYDLDAGINFDEYFRELYVVECDNGKVFIALYSGRTARDTTKYAVVGSDRNKSRWREFRLQTDLDLENLKTAISYRGYNAIKEGTNRFEVNPVTFFEEHKSENFKRTPF